MFLKTQKTIDLQSIPVSIGSIKKMYLLLLFIASFIMFLFPAITEQIYNTTLNKEYAKLRTDPYNSWLLQMRKNNDLDTNSQNILGLRSTIVQRDNLKLVLNYFGLVCTVIILWLVFHGMSGTKLKTKSLLYIFFTFLFCNAAVIFINLYLASLSYLMVFIYGLTALSISFGFYARSILPYIVFPLAGSLIFILKIIINAFVPSPPLFESILNFILFPFAIYLIVRYLRFAYDITWWPNDKLNLLKTLDSALAEIKLPI